MLTARTIPGIAFRVETPTTVSLPRMDIAAFVGFAQRGPVHLPVVVESYPEFVNVFGGLYPLAWDGEQGLWQTACLAPAVQAFFAQGGRRCWVVRVAGAATTTRFPLGGLLQTTALGGYQAVTAQARCPGGWADDLQTRVDLLVTSLGVLPQRLQPGRPTHLSIPRSEQVSLQPGDLLQLEMGDRRHRVYVTVPPLDRSSNRGTIDVTPSQVHWFHRLLPEQFPMTGRVRTLDTARSTTGQLDILEHDRQTETIHQAKMSLSTGLDIELGDWLRMTTAHLNLWLQVEQILQGTELMVSVWAEGADPAIASLPISRIQHLQLALKVRPAQARSRDQVLTLDNLAGSAPHPRFIGYLPSDEQLLSQPASPLKQQAANLWAEVMAPRFPVSLSLDDTTTVIPLGLDRPLPWRSGQVSAAYPIVRDGLVPETSDAHALNSSHWASFLPTLFLDPHLRTTLQDVLISEASDRLYLQNQPLTGLHALLPLDEVSMIVLTDAAHPGWQLSATETLDIPLPQPPAPSDPCTTAGPFQPCRLEPNPNSPESLSQPATPATRWHMLPSQNFVATGLLDIQQAAARLAAARGDWVTLLGLPKHYRPADVQTHQRLLLTAIQRDGETTDSYIALYHPWLISRAETGSLIHSHPAGAIAGVMAARSLRRGAWIAPANEPLRGVLATVPSLSPADEQAFYRAGINPIRPSPQGFVPWGSFTQSMDVDLTHLNVRRLLILVRRLALRDGQNLVFAPHSPAVQRRVQYQFEQILHRLFDLGAFAGSTPDEAYRVVIDDRLNRRSRVEQGQLRVDLRVAPSQPMTFITVRLVQRDADPITVQEVWPYDR
ncbi:MAG: hypothetical protein EA367_00500 [Leptolyngbya sp. DLM2.Bin15]|nr:MAG: hypothetical protein EA367_00500 [Leptolyngbya sp. DLM2.Bin15]